MADQLYKYVWGNEKDDKGKYHKKNYKDRICRALIFGKRNSVQIEFLDNGEMLICSRWAIRKVEADNGEENKTKS